MRLLLLLLGLRLIPEGETGWRLRWEAPSQPRIDGRPLPGGTAWAEGPFVLADDAGRWEVPARPGNPCATLRFVVLGDGRAAADGVGPSAYWRAQLGEALAVQPAFVVDSGDLVKNPGDPAEWAQFLGAMPVWPPLLVVRGNHDRGPLFDALGLVPGPVWAWRFGPALIVGVDTEVGDFAALLPEIDAALGAPAAWKIVVMHRPIWSRGNHGSDERGFNDRLVPIFDRHHVDLVIAGHDHDYERFCPSRGVGAARQCVEPEAGTVYVVSGGAATFTNPVPGVARGVSACTAAADRAASRVFSGAGHFVQIDIQRGVLWGRAMATRAGNVRPPGELDRFVLTKAMPECEGVWDGGR